MSVMKALGMKNIFALAGFSVCAGNVIPHLFFLYSSFVHFVALFYGPSSLWGLGIMISQTTTLCGVV